VVRLMKLFTLTLLLGLTFVVAPITAQQPKDPAKQPNVTAQQPKVGTSAKASAADADAKSAKTDTKTDAKPNAKPAANLEASSAKPDEVKKTLKFDQEKATANMRELEDRMIKLGELLRDAEPEDSARLLLGVQKAREKLILEQMREATAMIESLDLSQASEEQKAIIVKLQQLKELLLNADLDLQLKLEQLKKIQQARRQLAELKAR
jgi:hypothetical protein